ncbi:putative RNA polymerase sigma factor FecI [compost metagenome]
MRIRGEATGIADVFVSDDTSRDPDALSPLLRSHYAELRNFARLKAGDASAAEDLVQEAYLRLVNSDVSALRNPRAFLYRVLNNLSIDHLRRQRRTKLRFKPLEDNDVADEREDIERGIIARQRLKILEDAIGDLPPRCRECFILRRFDNLSHAEIAERMGITKSAVEKHLAAATAHCARRLRAKD